MAAKKDAPATEAADDVAVDDGYPEASDTGEAHSADHAAPDSVGTATDAPVISDDPAAPPLPITPATPQAAAQARVLYEDEINANSRAFAELAQSEYIRATLGGFPVSIVVDDGLD